MMPVSGPKFRQEKKFLAATVFTFTYFWNLQLYMYFYAPANGMMPGAYIV